MLTSVKRKKLSAICALCSEIEWLVLESEGWIYGHLCESMEMKNKTIRKRVFSVKTQTCVYYCSVVMCEECDYSERV